MYMYAKRRLGNGRIEKQTKPIDSILLIHSADVIEAAFSVA